MSNRMPAGLPEFSLDEAARIRQRLMVAHEPVACPRCGAELRLLEFDDGDLAEAMVTCRSCGAGMLMPPLATAVRD